MEERYSSNKQEEADCRIPKEVQEQLVEHYCRVYEGAYDTLINIQKRISGTLSSQEQCLEFEILFFIDSSNNLLTLLVVC